MIKQELVDHILNELKDIYQEKDLDASKVNESTVLFGSSSDIDSLELVGLIVKVEDYILEKTGKEIQVIDEDSIITGKTPFENATSLAELAIKKGNSGK